MSEKILKTRIPQKTDTTENWNSSTLVLLDSELGVEKLEDGSKKFKWGDGVNVWRDLPYATGEALNHILDGIGNGSVRTSLATSESVEYKLGTAAFAQGQGTKASGNFSHAEGFSSNAAGAYSHAEGRSTTASGSVSHAEGTDTVASGIRSHAGGYGTIAKGENQTAIGKYNLQDDNNKFAFIVGNGTSSSRANAFTVDWNGNVEANGKKLATEEYAQGNGGKIDNISVNGENLTIEDKSVNIEVPTKVSELENDAGFLNEHQDISGLAPKATTLGGYGITDAYTKTQADAAATTQINAAIGGLDKADTAVSGQYVSSVSEADGIITVTRETLPDYSVEVVESTPEGYAKAYTFTQAATGLNATINIPKDMVVQSGQVEVKTSSGEWGLAGTYLVLTLANATNDRIYIDVSTLIEYVTSGSTETDSVQVVVDGMTHKVTASIKDGSITKEKLDETIQSSLTKADNAAPRTAVDELNSKIDEKSDVLMVTISGNTSDGFTSDYSYSEIVQAASEGKTVLCTAGNSTKKYYGQLAYIDNTLGICNFTAVQTFPISESQKNIIYYCFYVSRTDTNTVTKGYFQGAAADLSNVTNEVFKEKAEASGFSSGTQIQLITWEATD